MAEPKRAGTTPAARLQVAALADLAALVDNSFQIQVRSDPLLTYKDLFGEQEVTPWDLDKSLPECSVQLLGISDYNLSVNGTPLALRDREIKTHVYEMTSVSNNDRGTLIVPDAVVENLPADPF